MNVSTTLLLIRHGETDWNIAGKAQGTKDIPLNETGIRQAQDLALLLRKSHPDIAHIYSSDLLRALKTAEPLSYLSQLPILQHTLLRERNMGLAEGLTRSERSKLYGTEEIPEAETFLEVTQRAQNALTTIAHTHLGKKIAIITHGMLIFRVLEDLTQTFLETIPNCSFISISYQKKAEQPFTFLEAFHGPKERI